MYVLKKQDDSKANEDLEILIRIYHSVQKSEKRTICPH